MVAMNKTTARVAIVAGARTPFAKMGGPLRDVHVTDLAKTAWQETEDVSKLAWPLEVISFQAARVGKRFRFTLTCIDFHREWESEWPQLL